MIVKMSDYEQYRKFFNAKVEAKNDKQKQAYAVEYSACMHVPVIITYQFLIDLGINKIYLQANIDELCKLYGTTLDLSTKEV